MAADVTHRKRRDDVSHLSSCVEDILLLILFVTAMPVGRRSAARVPPRRGAHLMLRARSRPDELFEEFREMSAASRARRAVKKLKVPCLGLLHCAAVQVPFAHGVELFAITVIRWMDKVVVASLCFGGDQVGVHSDLLRLCELPLGSCFFFAVR